MEVAEAPVGDEATARIAREPPPQVRQKLSPVPDTLKGIRRRRAKMSFLLSWTFCWSVSRSSASPC